MFIYTKITFAVIIERHDICFLQYYEDFRSFSRKTRERTRNKTKKIKKS